MSDAPGVSEKLGRERPPWPCGCPNEHANVATRSWCSACSEWCYPDALCVRGEAAELRVALANLITHSGVCDQRHGVGAPECRYVSEAKATLERFS